MIDALLKKAVKFNGVILIVLALVFLCAGKAFWSLGVILGGMWSTLNIILTIHLLKIALLKESRSRMGAFLLLKFPALYLLGILILTSRWFPLGSLFLGLSSIFLALGAVKLWPLLSIPRT